MHESLIFYYCSFCWPRFWKFITNSGSIKRDKRPQSSRSVVEATDPFKWAPTSMPNKYNEWCITPFIRCGYTYDWNLPLYSSSSWLSFWMFPRIHVTSGGANHSKVWKLRLYIHSSGLTNQCQTHNRCYSTFICCGCTYDESLLCHCRFRQPSFLKVFPDIWLLPEGQTRYSVGQ
jgi:hypothetical protein